MRATFILATVIAVGGYSAPVLAQTTQANATSNQDGAASPSLPEQSSSVPGQAMVVGGQTAAVLRTGTPVPLKLDEPLTTKHKQLRVGQRFRMEVAANVMVDGHVVIPAGSPAIGQITDVRNKGMWGKSGHLAAQVLYVTVNGRQIRLSGAFDDKGHAGGVGAVATSAIVFAPAGFFMTGTSAEVPIGAPVNAFIDEDVPLSFANTAPKPMAVPDAPQQVQLPVASSDATVAIPASAVPKAAPKP